MENRVKVGLAGILLASTFAAGRYSVSSPAVTAIQEIKKDVVKDTDRDTHKQTTTVTEKDPTGKTKTTTTVTEDTTTKKHVDTSIDKSESVVVTPSKPSKVNVSALMGVDYFQKTVTYGISANKEFIGPITLGAFGLTNGTVGISLGLNF